MFGKRPTRPRLHRSASAGRHIGAGTPAAGGRAVPPAKPQAAVLDARLVDIRVGVFNALLDAVDLNELSKLGARGGARRADRHHQRNRQYQEIRAQRCRAEPAGRRDLQRHPGPVGPLEPLLARDDIADIMVNGQRQGLHRDRSARSSCTDIKFRDNGQLMNICQRIVSARRPARR